MTRRGFSRSGLEAEVIAVLDDSSTRCSDAYIAEMPAGTVVLYKGSVIHAGGTNSATDRSRAAIHLSFVAGWLRTEEAHLLSTPPDEARHRDGRRLPRGRRAPTSHRSTGQGGAVTVNRHHFIGGGAAELSDVVENRVDDGGDEFAGACFSPDRRTLFVNRHAREGVIFAIWREDDRVLL